MHTPRMPRQNRFDVYPPARGTPASRSLRNAKRHADVTVSTNAGKPTIPAPAPAPAPSAASPAAAPNPGGEQGAAADDLATENIAETAIALRDALTPGTEAHEQVFSQGDEPLAERAAEARRAADEMVERMSVEMDDIDPHSVDMLEETRLELEAEAVRLEAELAAQAPEKPAPEKPKRKPAKKKTARRKKAKGSK